MQAEVLAQVEVRVHLELRVHLEVRVQVVLKDYPELVATPDHREQQGLPE